MSESEVTRAADSAGFGAGGEGGGGGACFGRLCLPSPLGIMASLLQRPLTWICVANGCKWYPASAVRNVDNSCHRIVNDNWCLATLCTRRMCSAASLAWSPSASERARLRQAGKGFSRGFQEKACVCRNSYEFIERSVGTAARPTGPARIHGAHHIGSYAPTC